MSKEKTAVKPIHRIYKVNGLDQLMFGFVRGVRAALHTVTIPSAIQMFMDEFQLTDEDYDVDCAAVAFNRMQNELKRKKL